MTGKDLIIYILQNNFEDTDITINKESDDYNGRNY